MDMIKPTSFYSSKSEKTKLNWFCYEFAMGVYDDIKEDMGKRLKRHKISDEVLAEFSIYISKEMKDIVLQMLSGKIKKAYFSYEMIEAYFPNLSDRMVNKMLDVIAETWDKQLSFCEICPNRCISEKDVYCIMFDEKELFL
jgi:uncharacterized Fe-S radical SAM superfamily protein PflX